MALAVWTATFISFISDYSRKMGRLIEVGNSFLLSHPSLAFVFDSDFHSSLCKLCTWSSVVDRTKDELMTQL